MDDDIYFCDRTLSNVKENMEQCIVDIQENINQHETHYQVINVSTTIQLCYKDKVERNLNLIIKKASNDNIQHWLWGEKGFISGHLERTTKLEAGMQF